MKYVAIIEFPSNLGLKQKEEGHEPGIKKLPDWLKLYGFHELIKPIRIYRLEPPEYSMAIDKSTGVRNADSIHKYAIQQAALLDSIISTDTFPLVIGGDCSILIGSALALRKKGNYGLFFLDGHTDFIPANLSQTKAAAGMDLAIITGLAHNKLANIHDLKPYVREEFVWCVGNREYDESYLQPIKDSVINYYDLESLRKTGIETCIFKFLQMIESADLDGFWIHIDVDVLNDKIMPAVDSRQKDGLDYSAFNQILKLLLSSKKAAGLQITILDPDLDPDGKYTMEFINNFCSSFNDARRN